MAPPTPNIPYDEVKPLLTDIFHAGRSAAQADLYALQWEGKPALLKDFSARPWWIRGVWGRLIIARELRAMRRLHSVKGIPEIYARVGPYAILFERLNARRLPRNRETPPPVELFDKIHALVGELHKREIGHGDLRRMNIMMNDANEPFLIDFATSVSCKPGLGGLPFRFLFKYYARVDRYQVSSIKSDFYPDQLTEEERRDLDDLPLYLRVGHWFKKYVVRMRKPHHRRRIYYETRNSIYRVLFGPKPK